MALEGSRVAARLLLQHDDPRIVGRQLPQVGAAQRIHPAVADARKRHVRRLRDRGDHRRAHAGVIGVRLRFTEDAAVGDLQRGDQSIRGEGPLRVDAERPREIVAVGAHLQERVQRVDREMRCHFAGVVAAHAVGDDQQTEIAIPQHRILVDRADGARMRA